jgi:hypothetical protein
MDNWRLDNWNAHFSTNPTPMTPDEIEEAIAYLRDNNYPKPQDCPEGKCPDHRPACTLGICKIAVVMCGDF